MSDTDLFQAIQSLRKYQAWRTGEDERTMDEAGVVPREVTKALNAVLEVAEGVLKSQSKINTSNKRVESVNQCSGCGKSGSEGWALYCVECIDTSEHSPEAPNISSGYSEKNHFRDATEMVGGDHEA